jgi:hypothetical protein
MSLREISGTLALGQQEPHLRVPLPASREAKYVSCRMPQTKGCCPPLPSRGAVRAALYWAAPDYFFLTWHGSEGGDNCVKHLTLEEETLVGDRQQ